MIGKTLTHFEILEQLGSGGMGVVYRARDVLLDRIVALKVLQGHRSDSPGGIRRFIQEAKAASALNHPNIVTVYEIEKTPEGQDFMAMEFIEGRTLRDLIKTPPPFDSLTDIICQTARALAAAHGKGIVHRDIKPENIMLRHDGYVKVLDFGLAYLPAQEVSTMDTPITLPGVVLGTAAYMSPEQARGESITPATDIFSLGIVFHELAAGRHPFESPTVFATVSAIQSSPSISLSRLVPGFPADIEALILMMLEKDPSRRPTAAQVVDALAPAAIPSATEVVTIRSARRFLVGRDNERAELQRDVETLQGGRGHCVFISGEPGIGKTTLVESLMDETARLGIQVARGRCSERLSDSEGYLPILEALESLMRGSAGVQYARLLRLVAPSWYVQLSSPSRDSSAGALEQEWKGAPLERMKRELVGFLEEASRSHGLVLFLDDLHWADLSTTDVLGHVASRCPSMRLLILGTYRPTDLVLAKHPFQQVKLDLVSRGVAREIPLHFFHTEDVQRYLDLNFAGHHFPSDFAGVIFKRTEGNPLFVTDLLRELKDEGILRKDGQEGYWLMTRPLPEIAERMPQSVRSLIERKIDRLSEDDRRLLSAAAIQGPEFDTAVVSRAAELDPADVEERLDLLEKMHGFVRQSEEKNLPDGTFSIRYQFVHILYQNAFFDLLRPTRRASLSAAVAQALLEFHGPKSDQIAAELAHLFEMARNPSRAIEFCLPAARHASLASAHREAVAICRRGLDLAARLPESPERSRAEIALLLTLGPSMIMSGGYSDPETERAYSRVHELCSRAGDKPELFQALIGLSAFYFFRPRLAAAREITLQEIRIAEEVGDLEMLVWAYMMRASVLGHIGEFSEALRLGRHACDCYKKNPILSHISHAVHDPGPLAFGQTARILWTSGLPDQALETARSGLETARRNGHAYTIAMSLFFLCWLHQYRGEEQEAEELLAELAALTETRGFVNLRPWVGSLHGWAIAAQGQLEEGIAEMRRSLDFLLSIGAGLMTPQYMGTLAEMMGRRGDTAGGLALVEQAVDQAGISGEHFFDAELLRIKSVLLGLQGQGAEAEREALLVQSIALAQQQGALSFELRATSTLARLRKEQNRAAEGRQALGAVYARFTEGAATRDLSEAASILAS